MNFQRFYSNAKNRLTDAALSLWATGEDSMQKYMEHILNTEPLMGAPVVQSAFPWENAAQSFGETEDIFDAAFIKALNGIKDADFRFPVDRHPYKHQIESWKTLLEDKKSIAVTTGTGSGKTECFMLPVLYDLYQNCRNETGVNAIFLYPLNALIGSQRKRMHAWCKALDGVRYAVYNGQTAETVPVSTNKECYPEVISRKDIREQPPQILFTNPSMLEYILVRNKDVPLLKKSQGKLRWILMDEAHTLTGSTASEMALLIRRVADAFGVETKDLRFAITSATVGSDPESFQKLQEFMALLCGIPEENILVITGNRVLPQGFPKATQSISKGADLLLTENPETFHQVHQLRSKFLKENALPLSEVGEILRAGKLVPEGLKLLDKLSERQLEGKSILPLRVHFFARGVGGIWVCTNRECKHHQGIIPNEAIGSMTTIAGTLCSCGAPVFELVACRSCSHQLLEAEKIITEDGQEQLGAVSAIVQDAFQFDKQEEEEEVTLDEGELQMHRPPQKFYFTRRFPHARLQKSIETFSLKGSSIDRNEDDFVCLNSGASCPYCDSEVSNPNHFRLSSSFINRVLADIFLEETPPAEKLSADMLWQGHKYISFTDSRQGTAKISALINQDNESRWIRAQVFHKLCEKTKNWQEENTVSSAEELQEVIEQLEKELAQTKIPILARQKEKTIKELKEQQQGLLVAQEKVYLSWQDLKSSLSAHPDFFKLFQGNNPKESNPNAKEHYLTAILYDQFSRRLPRERSLENLGMVSLVYPKLQKVPLPAAADTLKVTPEEWQMLLKIAVDYVIRYPFHFWVADSVFAFTTRFFRSDAIYNPDAQEVNVKRWPHFDKYKPNRLALLLCAGLGYHHATEIDNTLESQINALLEELWKAIKINVLEVFNDGFKMNLETASAFQLSSQVWLCPVKRRLIDAHFRGYSPWIKGHLTPENVVHYKIHKSIEIPLLPFPYNRDEEKNLQIERTRVWIEEHSALLRKDGVWNNLHEQVILNQPLFLAGEHSAQQTDARLKELEGAFELGKLNVLNCSTTMEMGVDIGGISTVVMNNVPPAPANYLQRAGRAGRRAEAKATAFTVCAPNPVGLQVMNNPMWALKHKIAPPHLSFQSTAVIERHINAFFLGRFVQTEAIQGLNVKTNVQNFFTEENAIASRFLIWLQNGEANACKPSLVRILKDTPYRDKAASFLLTQVAIWFDSLFEMTRLKTASFDKKLVALQQEFGDDSPAYKAVNHQKRLFQEKNAIVFMVQEGFLPSAGLPTGIVEFDTNTINDFDKKKGATSKKSSKPSYFITRALVEFAPGKKVVIDGRSFLSAGIILRNERGSHAEREVVQSCGKCGYQRILEAEKEQTISSKCPHCEGGTFKGLKLKTKAITESFTEMIQPAGFAVDIYQQPNRNIEEFAGNVQYIDPLLLNVNPWLAESTSLYEIRDSEENGEILFYNTGAGDGYAVCLHCGRTAYDKESLKDHKRLRGGKAAEQSSAYCSGTETPFGIKEHVILGGRFQTNYCELRLRDEHGSLTKDESLLYTLGAILSKELAHYLAVEPDEIGFGIKKYDKFSTVFFFDTAKGGAGYSSQMASYIAEIILNAKQKLESCTCDKACTKCLIDRNTQWHLPQLDRKKALSWLEGAANMKVPEQFLAQYPNLRMIPMRVHNEIVRLVQTSQVAKIYLYVSNNIAAWSAPDLTLLEMMRNRVEVNLVMPEFSGALPEAEQLTLIQVLAWSKIWTPNSPNIYQLQPLCKIELQSGEVIEYLAEDYEKDLNQTWGLLKGGVLYQNKANKVEPLTALNLRVHNQQIYEAALTLNSPIPSDSIADLLISELQESVDLKSIMQGQSFKLTYSDRYLRTSFGVVLLMQFINRLRTLLGFEVDAFSFSSLDFSEERNPYRIHHNFKEGTDRDAMVKLFARQIGITNFATPDTDLPHYRFFEFRNDNLKITLRPDGGIEHGWSASGVSALTHFDSASMDKTLQIEKRDTNPLLYTLSIKHTDK